MARVPLTVTSAEYRDPATGVTHTYLIPSMWLVGFCQSILASNPQASYKACMLAAVQHWHEQAEAERLS